MPEQEMPKKEPLELVVDPERWKLKGEIDGITGYYVRAQIPDGGYDAVDIALLTKQSLRQWLEQYGDINSVHVNILGHLLGHKGLGENEL